MPLNVNMTEDGGQDSNSKPEHFGGTANNESTNNSSLIAVEQRSTSKQRTFPLESRNEHESSTSRACDKTDLQQQVLQKLKGLSLRIKMTREQCFFNVEGATKQNQLSVITSCSKSQKLETATRPKIAANSTMANTCEVAGISVPKIVNEIARTEPERQQVAQKSRRQLEMEVFALQKLLVQLSLQSPQLRTMISTMAQGIPELKHNELFVTPRLEGGSERGYQSPSTSRYINGTRQHLESVGINEDDEQSEKRIRKRGIRGGKRRNNNNKQKSQVVELQDLCKYINGIVDDYILKNEANNTELRSNLHKFDGGFDKLEEYAKFLVNLGLGRIVEDELRVNRKNNRQSFITMSNDREALERDGMIMLPVARRYAFEGDVVRAFVLNTSANSDSSNEKSVTEKVLSTSRDLGNEIIDEDDALEGGCETPDSDLDSNELDTTGPIMAINCPKAFVIDIIKHTDDRKVVGSISFKQTVQLSDDMERNYFKFKPLDARMPLMYVPESSGSQHSKAAKARNEVTDMLFLAQVCETDVNGHCIAELVELVGKVGHLEHELKAILLHNGFKDLKPYEQKFDDMFKDPGIPILSKEEMNHRLDLRKSCIFTIDPLTARDLDDALSIDLVPDKENEFEVGVHIADVAYFIDEGSELDDLVKKRATSIYLVNEVIHMLPETLCFKCSLLPGEEKLAFSVFWRMDREGNVIGIPRFARSVINSCAKLAYAHAQKLIEDNNAEAYLENFPDIYNGFTLGQIADRVRILNQMASFMRHRRFEDGALSINNPKLRFELHPINGEPLSYEIDRQQDANHMIEEFMLLANMSVARRIYTYFPDTSILRNHAPPLMTAMKNLQERLVSLGINLDISSSKTVYESLMRICSEAEDPKAMCACLSTMLTKPMARAKYFCSEDKTEAEMWHYALAIQFYTHFTSPIRRYPDILVHRLLAASLNYCPPPQRTPDELREVATVCNTQKYNAKCAGDESSMLYFKRFVKSCQGVNMRAVVLEIHQHLTNVVTVETGHVLPIQYKAQKVIVDKRNAPAFIHIVEKGSMQPPLKLQTFSPVDIKLVVRDEKLTAFFVSPDLRQRQLNCIESSGYRQRNRGNNSRKYHQSALSPEQHSFMLKQQQKLEVIKKKTQQQQRQQQNARVYQLNFNQDVQSISNSNSKGQEQKRVRR